MTHDPHFTFEETQAYLIPSTLLFHTQPQCPEVQEVGGIPGRLAKVPLPGPSLGFRSLCSQWSTRKRIYAWQV